jgi:hypothetical protein
VADQTVIISAELTFTLAQAVPSMAGDVALGSVINPLGSSLSLNPVAINITDDIKFIVTNVNNFAISEYAALAFNSMAKFNGKYLYAKADGIYEGGGDDDNGTRIDASYKTGQIDIYRTEIQRIREAFLNFRSDGDIQFFNVSEGLTARAYLITNSTPDTLHERRVKLERGIKDRHFNFGVSNVNGSTLEIDTAKVLTEPLRKRR